MTLCRITRRGTLHESTISCDDDGCTRVVVVNPDDPEQVERLVGTIGSHFAAFGQPVPADIHAMSAALREFAQPTPPKPDEPTGLGAVVEDEAGQLWVRRGGHKRGWLHATQPVSPCHWDEVAAVRVLSEGVTP